ncbi:hypothetical protein [Streptomyces sp. NPDC001530]|uniref:hypothetical protein n=1 Tax=Streptomyces sp. NPDC001530 TaxID=3364582 RepID=UPI0036AD045A
MGRRGGCVLNGCLTVLVTALGLVLFGVWWVGTAPGRADARARDEVEEAVDGSRDRLSRAASDGSLLGTEIDRLVPNGYRKVGPEVERHDRRVTITTEITYTEDGWFGGSATGCYRFEVVPASSVPPVSVHELPEARCDLPRAQDPGRLPAAVAADVVVELRAALAEGGLAAVQSAPVWATRGIDIEDQETEEGQLTDLVWLSAGLNEKVCYEFRTKETPGTVTAERLTPDGCYRIQREEEARAEAEERAELDASSRQIEHRLDRAVADGTLTDAELKRALALQKTDEGNKLWFDAPVAVPVSVERSPSEVIVVTKVEALDINRPAVGCYAFRASLARQSVTRRTAAGTDCFG